AWFSMTCAGLKEHGWLCGVITVGQAFGGDLDTVTLHTGLLAARHVLGADVAVVAQGPGNLGTGTRRAFSGVCAGDAVHAAAVLAGAQLLGPALRGPCGERVREQAAPLADRHELVHVPVDGLEEALKASPVRLSTMGRGLDEDRACFLAAAAAGRHTAALLGLGG